MKDSLLVTKSNAFAIQIIKLCEQIKNYSALTNQLLRSGTSIGANIHESIYAQGKNDFISKLQIALKECSETEYWLYLFNESGIYNVDDEILENDILVVVGKDEQLKKFKKL